MRIFWVAIASGCPCFSSALVSSRGSCARSGRRDSPGPPGTNGTAWCTWPCPAPVDIADDVAHEVLGSDDLDLHHRLEEHGLGLGGRLLERHRPGDLEGHLRGVDLVVRAVDQAD